MPVPPNIVLNLLTLSIAILGVETISVEMIIRGLLPAEMWGVIAFAVSVFGLLIFLYFRSARRNRAKSALAWETSYEGVQYQAQALAAYREHKIMTNDPLGQPGNSSTTLQPRNDPTTLQPANHSVPLQPRNDPITLQPSKPFELIPAMPFDASAPTRLPEMENAATMADTLDITTSPDELTRPVPVASIASRATAYLEYVSGGEHLPQQFSITAGKLVRFGRSERYCDYVLDDLRVSRLHASIQSADGDFYLEDEGSSGGTFVNRRRLKVADRNLLFYGDLINFNEITYRFKVVN